MALRGCPACHATKCRLLHKQKFTGGAVHKIVNCTACGFVYVKNTLSKDYYAGHYAKESIYEFTRDEDIHEESFKYVNKYVPKDAYILDIGCSTGNLLGIFKKNGYSHVLGVDPSHQCKAIAWSNYRVRVVSETLETFHSKRKYDLVILNNVLEHLHDVRNSVVKIKNLLNNNGYLFIAVPDAETFYTRIDEPFYEFSLEHINFFSANSLSKILTDFSPVKLYSDNRVLFSLWRQNMSLTSAMRKYIDLSTNKMSILRSFMRTLPKDYLAWGAGSLARRLVVTTSLRPKYFVDRNYQLYKNTIENIPIISPKEAVKMKYPVLIISYRFKSEIKRQIKKYFRKIIELP